MITYITFLRALAAILITNAHFTGVYPTDLIANGGLLGDVIFFAVSGFCLYNIKDNFINWYKKRIIRIYPKVWIITAIYLIIGFYTLEYFNIFNYFVFPTYYHFVGSIILLYVFYYIVIKNKLLKENLLKVIIGTAIIQLIVYIFAYDKSYYHIDVVREPMIRFLFFEAMLLGAYFRMHKEKYINKKNTLNWILLIVSLIVYFASKILFTKIPIISFLQILNQYCLIVGLYFVLKSFASIDSKLEKTPKRIKNCIEYIARITLEIYLVQYPIIPLLSDKMIFPLNWICIVLVILILATILHYSVDLIINKIVMKGKKSNETIVNRSI